MTFETHNPYYFTRVLVMNLWLDALQASKGGAEGTLLALEVGRIRRATETSGHSTLHIASHPAVKRLISVDQAVKTEAVCREFLPSSALGKIEFVNDDGVKWLSDEVAHDGHDFDFIYLDAADDAEQGRALLIECVGVSHAGTIIIMDDTDHPGVHKGDAAIPYAREHPELFTIIKVVPRDGTCQGLTVMRVEDTPCKCSSSR